jgi:hypothetical protein
LSKAIWQALATEREHGAGRVGAQERKQGRVGVRDYRVKTRLDKRVTDPVPRAQRHFPLRRQAAGQYDDTFKIAHGMRCRPY